MDELKRDVLEKGLPWGRDVRWPVVAIEALILLGAGVFMLIWTDTAGDVILQVIGVILLVISLVLALATLRNQEGGLGVYDAFRAGIGATAGAIATVSWWSDYIADAAVRSILGWGLLAYSLFSLVGLVMVRGMGGLRPGALIAVAFSLVLGILLLTSSDTRSSDRITLLGVTFVVFGVLLAALAWYLYSRANRLPAPAPRT